MWGEQKEERKDGEWSKTIKDQLAHLKDNQQ
jgi:hypothetical protein